jgi:hypothetical protein
MPMWREKREIEAPLAVELRFPSKSTSTKLHIAISIANLGCCVYVKHSDSPPEFALDVTQCIP